MDDREYLTWWESLPYSSGNASWDWLPSDPLFHEWAARVLGRMPDPRRRRTEASALYFAQLWSTADLWRYMRMRQLEGKPLFTEPAGAA